MDSRIEDVGSKNSKQTRLKQTHKASIQALKKRHETQQKYTCEARGGFRIEKQTIDSAKIEQQSKDVGLNNIQEKQLQREQTQLIVSSHWKHNIKNPFSVPLV